MLYSSEDYEYSLDGEINELLTEFPLDLMRENIISQIKNPLSTHTNYLDTVLTRYKVLKDKYNDNLNALDMLDGYIEDFCVSILEYITKYLGVYADSNVELSELIPITDSMYTFFVINYRENVVNFFYNYIRNNKKWLSEQYDKSGKRKDVTTMNYKKKLKNKDDINILSNLPSVINFVRDLSVTMENFITTVADTNTVEGRHIIYLMNQSILSGDFVDIYLDIIFDKNDYIMDEIQIELKDLLNS